MGASPATIIKNFPCPIEGWDSEKGYPYIGSESYIGPLTLRQGVVNSLNVAAARTLLEHVGFDNSANYLEAAGSRSVTHIEDGLRHGSGHHKHNPIEMAAAYGAIANGASIRSRCPLRG